MTALWAEIVWTLGCFALGYGVGTFFGHYGIDRGWPMMKSLAYGLAVNVVLMFVARWTFR